MGTIRHGALGGFSGKAGSIIGSSWNNVSYIKGLHKLSKKPASLKQLDQRARFATVLGYLGPIKDVLMIGWKGQTANRATGFNMGVQYALSYAVVGTYPDYSVDKSLIQISKGTLQSYKHVTVDSSVPGVLELSWNPQINDLTAFAGDVLKVVLYNEEQKLFLLFGNAGLRADASTTLEVPNDYFGQTIHAYMFYQNNEGTRQSISTYVGPII